MNEKHIYMFILGILMQDIKELFNLGIRFVFKKTILRRNKSFEHKAPLLDKLHEELTTLKNKNED